MKKYVSFLFGSTIILAAILRFYQIDKIPVSLYWDEAASTYNAYSIALTGKDEFGTSLPLLFRSFNDYKMSGNIYLTALFVKIFGLNEFSARVPSAFLGTATVLVTFFLVQTMLLCHSGNPPAGGASKILNAFPAQRGGQARMTTYKIQTIALLSAFMLAISPWHIQFSRTGFEANTGVFFIVTGCWLFLRSISQKSSVSFIISILSFSISFYFYRSIFLFVPFLLLILFSLYVKKVLKVFPKRVLVLSSVLFIIIFVPIFNAVMSPEGLTRAKQVAIVTNSSEKVYDAAKKQIASPGIIGKILYNRRVVYVETFVIDYASHFNPSFLFLNGDDNGRHGPRGMGLLYLWEILFIIIGLYALLKLNTSIRLLILAWIVISPIAAATSIPSPHALRSLNILPMPMILTALGISFVFGAMKKKWTVILASIVVSICIYSSIHYLNLYYYKTAVSTSAQWADGYKQLTQYVFAHEKAYDKVVITGYNWQPYIYFLFYKGYSPKLFQQYGTKQAFDKYVFGGTSWDLNGEELHEKDLKKFANGSHILVALSEKEFDSQKGNLRKLTEIRNHNNELVFIVGEM